jgi:hypothetical protein
MMMMEAVAVAVAEWLCCVVWGLIDSVEKYN